MTTAKGKFFVLSLLALLATSFASAGIKLNEADSSPSIYLDTPTTIHVCENFTVSIRVADVADLYAWQVKLDWDSALMEFVDAVEGDFLETGGRTEFNSVPDPGEGVWLSAHLTDALTPGVSGSGTLANVTLHCTGPGESALNLLHTRLFTSTQSVPWNGYGDANGDGKVDIKDLAIVVLACFTYIGDPLYNPAADFNSDGLVDYFDLMCVRCAYGAIFPSPVLIPVESVHITTDGWIYQKAEFLVTWRWVNGSEDVWYVAYIAFESSNAIQNFSYAQPLDYISFNVSSAGPGYCNATIPKLFMSGAFQVFLNDTLTPSLLTWNRTQTSVYFTYDQGTYIIKIRGEIATVMRGLWQLSDVNGDGIVDIFDIVRLGIDFGWHEP